jgi:hypothetical protein
LTCSRGDFALLSNTDLSIPAAPWQLHNIWSNGHVGIVRSVLWDEPVRILDFVLFEGLMNVSAQNNVVITGGEDSRLNAWSIEGDHMNVDRPSRKRSFGEDDDQVRAAFFSWHLLIGDSKKAGKRARR